jgi:hypothetical protein
VFCRVDACAGGIVAKALVKAARQATKASAEREARGERADGWFERAVDWAREKARARLRKDDDAPETVVAFDARSDEDVDEAWDAGEDEEALADRNDDGDDGDGDGGARPRESDGEGLGIRVLYEDTFEDVTARARMMSCDAGSTDAVDSPARWLIALCARTSQTCRALAPELALLSHDSAFAPEDASGYGVGWIDCTSDASRAWCVERFDVRAVPKIIAILPGGGEIAYDGTFEGAYVHAIRAWALERGEESGSCSS